MEILKINTVEAVPIIDVANSIEESGYFTDAPRVIDITHGASRPNIITQNVKGHQSDFYFEVPDEPGSFTETEGVQNLLSVLGMLENMVPHDESEYISYFKENLTYIGKQEFDQAIKGLAGYIFIFAAEHPDTKICLPLDWHRTETSEGLVRQKITDELAKLAGTEEPPGFIVDYETALGLPSEEVQFFLLDDWSVSGADMGGRVNRLAQSSKSVDGQKVGAAEDLSNAEVLLVVVRDDQLAHYETSSGAVIACKGYFRAPVPYKNCMTGPVPTGTHSSVDYGFQEAIKMMAGMARKNGTMPDRLNIEKTPIFVKRQHRNW